MLSCQQTQNVIDGKKRIILNPSEAQKRDFEAATFAEGEVYGMDILISSGEDGKVCIMPSISFSVVNQLFIISRLAWRNHERQFTNEILRSHTNSK